MYESENPQLKLGATVLTAATPHAVQDGVATNGTKVSLALQ